MLKKNEWKKLYEIAKEIQELKPWKKLWDTDLCMFIDKDTKKEYYFCTMGHNKAFKGVFNLYKRAICKLLSSS